MLAIDTNVVVRYLTGDHPEQSARARKLIESTDAFVATTVLLETEWVLRSVYGFGAERLAGALAAFCGLPRVRLLVAKALEWMANGLDFADSLHLARAEGCDAFATFDNRFAKAAKALGEAKVRVV